jgi:hypothetical protein
MLPIESLFPVQKKESLFLHADIFQHTPNSNRIAPPEELAVHYPI